MAIFLSPAPTHIFIFICDSYMSKVRLSIWGHIFKASLSLGGGGGELLILRCFGMERVWAIFSIPRHKQKINYNRKQAKEMKIKKEKRKNDKNK